MSLRVINDSGIATLKQRFLSHKENDILSDLILVDAENISKRFTTDDIMNWMTEAFPDMEGLITQSGRGLISVLIQGDNKSFLNRFIETFYEKLPNELSCSISDSEKRHELFYKATLVINNARSAHKGINIDVGGNLQRQRFNRSEKRLMVIDDDVYFCKLLSASLQTMFSVTEMNSAEGILERYREISPDMVLLDIHLEEESGLNLIEQIIEIDPDAYIIIMSADSVAKNVMTASKLGAQGFLAKPPNKEALQAYVRKCPTFRTAPSVRPVEDLQREPVS